MTTVEDVPSSIDLRNPDDARTWAREADLKRPWREHIRQTIAEVVRSARIARRILELGSGPGLLAEQILESCTVDSYALFDFSQPMLDMSRERVGHHPAARFVLGDFKTPPWPALDAPFDAVVAMQAIHEIRHKQHLPWLYRRITELLRPGGLLVVCDHEPPDETPRMTALHATRPEQHEALAGAGFVGVTTYLTANGMYVCGGYTAKPQ